MALCLALVLGVATQAVDPKYAQNITVFHVNEHKYGAIPVNMNTADAIGDVIFDLLEVLISPLTCANRMANSSRHGGPDPCTNPEAMGTDLMVNKVTLEVDNRFSSYGACNVAINGSDPFGRPCPTGTYCCDCYSQQHHGWPKPVQCNASVGYENVDATMGRYIGHDGCKRSLRHPFPSHADCYIEDLFTKLTPKEHGSWYSTLESGYCGKKGSSCKWRLVSVDKIVRRDCHTRVFGDVVQARGEKACLQGCGPGQAHNVSSPCWVECFYKAALGPDSYKPGGAVQGMSMEELTAAWLKPFLPEAKGGCPAQEERPPWFAGRWGP